MGTFVRTHPPHYLFQRRLCWSRAALWGRAPPFVGVLYVFLPSSRKRRLNNTGAGGGTMVATRPRRRRPPRRSRRVGDYGAVGGARARAYRRVVTAPAGVVSRCSPQQPIGASTAGPTVRASSGDIGSLPSPQWMIGDLLRGRQLLTERIKSYRCFNLIMSTG